MSGIDKGGAVYPESQNCYGGITRRDQCADRIAAAMISNSVLLERHEKEALKMADNNVMEASIQLMINISKVSYDQADAQIAEGRKK